MKNDLTKHEKDLLKAINMKHRTKFTYENLMEWSTNKAQVEKNLQDGEEIYEVLGCFIAIKD